MQGEVAIKAMVGDDVRRLGGASQWSWEQLLPAIQHRFGFHQTPNITYEDDEKDRVTIAGEHDFAEVCVS